MKEDRLNGLALMHIHKHDVSLNAEISLTISQPVEAGGWRSSSRLPGSSTLSNGKRKSLPF